MELSNQQKTTLGAVVVLAVFGALIYSASEQKLEVATLEATLEASAVLPIILPIEAVALPPLTNEVSSVLNADWGGLQPDGIPLLEIAYVEDAELPPLMEGSHTVAY